MTHVTSSRALWKGLCTGFSPDPVRTDTLIGKRIAKLGFRGTRQRGKCTFASTSRDQAHGYCDDVSGLHIVEPEPGAIVTWAHNVSDLVLQFEDFLRLACYDDTEWAGPTATDLLFDIQGCVHTFEDYLAMKSSTRSLNKIVDRFVANLDVREHVFETMDALTQELGSHDGEVWVTGKCRLIEVEPAAPSAVAA